jgi:hypothetical protein
MAERIQYKEKSYAFLVTVPPKGTRPKPYVYQHADLKAAQMFWASRYFIFLDICGAGNSDTAEARKIAKALTKRMNKKLDEAK